MKKFFSFVAAILFAGSMMAQWSEITFTAATAAGAFNDSVFAAGQFKLSCVDTDNNKLKTTANTSYFGTSDADSVHYDFRLQTSGKSSAKNALNLTIPEAGQLRIAVRTGSNGDYTRTLILTQGEDTLYNEVVCENDTIDGFTGPKIYKYVTVNVQAGTVAVTYPINALNFYAFAFKADGGDTPVDPQPADTLTCAQAAAQAAAGSEDEVIVKGYVTAIVEAWSSYKNISFWMADEVGGENVFEAFRVNCETAAEAPAVGDLVWVKGNLTYYKKDSVTYVPETKKGGSFGIIEKGTTPEPPVVTVDTVTCAEFNKLENNKQGMLGEVVVVYVNGSYTYVKDETGGVLVYASNFGLNVGDVVKGLMGTMSIYNNLPELKPSVALADLDVTAGEAPAIPEATAAPSMEQINQVLVYKNVTAEGALEAKKSLVAKFGEADLTIFNQFSLEYTFEAGKKYNVTAAVAIYKENIQVYFITAEEAKQEGIENVELTEKASKVVVNGMLYIIRDGKMFNATGAQVK